jgi:hypothetical protein
MMMGDRGASGGCIVSSATLDSRTPVHREWCSSPVSGHDCHRIAENHFWSLTGLQIGVRWDQQLWYVEVSPCAGGI